MIVCVCDTPAGGRFIFDCYLFAIFCHLHDRSVSRYTQEADALVYSRAVIV